MPLSDTKVYNVLKKFDKYEQNRCQKYIYSPYFNANVQSKQLFDLIVKDIWKSNRKGLSKKDTWKKLYPNKDYDDVRMRKHISDLLKLVEGYLAQQSYEKEPIAAVVNLLKSVDQRDLLDIYNSSIKSATYHSDKYSSLTASYFLHQYQIEDYSLNIINKQLDIDRKPENYIRAMKYLDQFFLAEKLRIYIGVLSRQLATVHSYQVDFIEEVIKYVESNLDDVSPNVEIYYRLYLIYISPENINNYLFLKELIEKHSNEFPKRENYNMYISLVNYCVQQIGSGNKEFYQSLFEIYKEMTANEVIVNNGLIDPITFKNIVVTSLNLEEHEWVENFIESNKKRIPEDQRENLVTFNLARLYFTQKKHEKVIDLLREVEYSDVSLALQAKSFLLMTYYDIEEHEPLESMLESFRVYLNRHKEIPQNRKMYFKNLIKFTKKLTRIIPGDKEEVAKIKKEIEETENFRVRWLEEKIAELEA